MEEANRLNKFINKEQYQDALDMVYILKKCMPFLVFVRKMLKRLLHTYGGFRTGSDLREVI